MAMLNNQRVSTTNNHNISGFQRWCQGHPLWHWLPQWQTTTTTSRHPKPFVPSSTLILCACSPPGIYTCDSYVDVYVCMCVCACVRVYVYIYHIISYHIIPYHIMSYIYISHIYNYMSYAYIYIYMCTHIYTYICIYIIYTYITYVVIYHIYINNKYTVLYCTWPMNLGPLIFA